MYHIHIHIYIHTVKHIYICAYMYIYTYLCFGGASLEGLHASLRREATSKAFGRGPPLTDRVGECIRLFL